MMPYLNDSESIYYSPTLADLFLSESFRKVLSSAGRLDEEAVGGILTLVNPKPYLPNGGDNWNLEVVAEVLAQECRLVCDGLFVLVYRWARVCLCISMCVSV
ncbi:hypothetical protein EON64_05165 [archaeon]|nr:MAG: hypothetical protein EON64_05165 [archaeon]